MRIIKGKDNFKPVKEIYKVNYNFREVAYLKNHLEAWQAEVLQNLGGMKRVIANHDMFFKNELEQLTYKTDRDYLKLENQIERGNYLNNHSNHSNEIAEVMSLQKLQRDSALITLFSIMEGNLNRVCCEFEVCLKSPIKLRDIVGKGSLDNYWVFLQNVVDIEIKGVEDLYREIKDYYYLRNRIIHDGNIIKDDNKIQNLEHKFPAIKIYKEIYYHRFYIKDEKLLFSLIETLINFFNQLYNELYKRIGSEVQIYIDPNLKLERPEN